MTEETGGLYRFMISADYIVHGRWLRACAEGSWVGDCRRCGGYLRAEEPYEHEQRFDYEARCISCGQTSMAPNGRVLRFSGRHSQMPMGWWDKRINQLKDEKAAKAVTKVADET